MSSIIRTLAVPTVNQLNDPASDGGPNNNANDDCLFACCASALMGYHPGGPRYDEDEIKDAVMGDGYVGFGYFCDALTRYLREQGVAISVATGSNLAGVAHGFIDRRIPLLAVIPSMWGARGGAVQPDFSTHVVLLCGDGPGALRAMNPWGGFWHDNPDAWWASRFCYGALWALIPKGGTGIGMAGVPAGWHDDGTTLTAPNGITTGGYIRAHILGESWPANLLPLAPLYGIAGGWQQDFAAASRSIVATTAGAVSEHAGPDYHAQVAQLTAQLDAANAEIAKLKAAGTGGSGGTPAEVAAAVVAAFAAKLQA